jgi:hypothetical protein
MALATPANPAEQAVGGPKLVGDVTVTGQVLGSPNYIPPEQAGAHRGQIGPASDIYGLGAVLYHVLTGRPPFAAESFEQTLDQVLHNEPAPPRLLNPSVPRDLETICLKCLEKEPGQRYGTAADLAAELDRFLQGVPIQARPLTRLVRVGRWCRREPLLAALLGSILVLLLLLVGGSITAAVRIDAARRKETVERHKAIAAKGELEQTNLQLSDTITQLELQRAEDLFAAGEDASALARLAGVLRHSPSNTLAGKRLISSLLYRNFALPAGPPLRHLDKVIDIQFSPNGRLLLSASDDGTAQLWDAQSGATVGAPFRHSFRVRSARFSPDGQKVATGSADKTARIWDVATGEPLTPPSGTRPQLSPSDSARMGNGWSLPPGMESPTSGRLGPESCAASFGLMAASCARLNSARMEVRS